VWNSVFGFQCCDVGYEPDELPDCSTPHYVLPPANTFALHKRRIAILYAFLNCCNHKHFAYTKTKPSILAVPTVLTVLAVLANS